MYFLFGCLPFCRQPDSFFIFLKKYFPHHVVGLLKIYPQTVVKSGFLAGKRRKKVKNFSKKGVDKREDVWYYNQARCGNG